MVVNEIKEKFLRVWGTFESHNVDGENPKNNAHTSIQWAHDEGIKLMGKNSSKLKSETQYSTNVNFELRQAP
ncbi:hypothetical protein [Enterococcus faecalis]|uniref:hypothetical protein n=1 Tax=Enterococcus faecalis TaxID=1351 RepID=UPI0027E0D480|nr:hypothetical protein [Enterococcus faecalis]MDQ6109811.1 hypothetical protein [Enterococcus faecalis]